MPFLVYKKTGYNDSQCLGLFNGSKEDLDALIKEKIFDYRVRLRTEISIYYKYKIQIKSFIDSNWKNGIRGDKLADLVCQESEKWFDKFDLLAVNFHINPNSGKIVMENIDLSSVCIIPQYNYEEIKVIVQLS